MPFGAILGASLISGGLGIVGANMAADQGADAATHAANLSAGASAATRKDLLPFKNAGLGALSQLMWLAGIEMPGQEFKSLDQIKLDLANSGQFVTGGSKGGSWQASSEGIGGMEWVPGEAGGTAGTLDQKALDAEAQKLFDAQRPRDATFGSLMKPFSFSMSDFYTDPGYQFRLEQGEDALTKAAAARGMNKSSATLKNLMSFNQNLASQEFGAAFARAFGVDNTNRERTQGLLMQLAGMGQSSAAMTGANAMSAANTAGAALMNSGNITANATMAGFGGLNNAIQGGLGNWMYQNRWDQQMGLMNSLFKPGGGSFTGPQLNSMAPS